MAFIALVFGALTTVLLAAKPPPLPANPSKGLVNQTSTDTDSREGRQYYGGGDGLRPYGYGGYGGYRGYGGDSGPSGYGGYGGWHGYGGYRDNSGYRGGYGGLER